MVKRIVVWVLLIYPHLILAQSSVSGKITDENDRPLTGAILSIDGSYIETATDSDGNYMLTSIFDFPWSVKITFDGYITRNLIIDSPGDYGTVYLAKGITLDHEIITTSSRTPEAMIEVAASVTSLNSRRIAVTPVNGDPTEYLRNVAGVNLIRSGTESANIELRGPLNVLETNTMVLKDHAPLTTSSDKILNSVASSLSPLDIAGIEVIRGPSGALYGPNATSGVIHYKTKDPFRFPGTSVMISGGERNLLTTRVRYAANNGSKWGWKFLTTYRHSNDFDISPDQLISDDGVTRVITPQNFETLGGKSWENIKNLNDIRLYNWNFEGGFDFRPNDNIKLNYTASLSRARTNITAPMDHLLWGLQRFEQQARLNLGNLFATIYHRFDFANIDNTGDPNNLSDHIYTFNYTYGSEGETQFAQPQRTENYLDISLQYLFEVSSKLQFQLGSEIKLMPAFEKSLIYGFNSGDNAYNIFGGYITGKYKFDKLVLHATGRIDFIDAYDKEVFSPRLGMVYNVSRHSRIRFDYSRSHEAPSRERTWMDYNFSSVLPSYFPATHILGVSQQISYDSPVTRFPFGDVPGGEMFNVQDILDVAAAHAGVPAPTLSRTVDPAITTASYAAPMVGFPLGFPITLDQAGTSSPAEISTVNQLQIGLNHTFKQKLQVNVDLFHTWRNSIQSNGAVVLSAGSQLNLLEIRNWLEQQVPPSAERDALIASLYTVPANPTTNPLFNGVPGFGVVLSDRAQQFGYAYDLGYLSYGKENINYYGADLSATYFFTPDLSVFGNYSYLSQVTWSASDLGETNPTYGYYLNTPPDRFNFGINYYPKEGIYSSVAMNYQSEYEGRQGNGTFFSGINQARTLVDLQVGYRFRKYSVDWDLGLSVNNLLDEKYSHFTNLAQLRRFAGISLKVSL